MYNSLKELYSYLGKEFFDCLSDILSNELQRRHLKPTSEDQTARIDALKESNSTNLKKIENEILQIYIQEIGSMLNLAFLTIFYNDFIDPIIEFSYQQKIDPEFFAQERSKLEEETRQMVKEENLLCPRSIDYKILKRLNQICKELFSTDSKLIKKFLNSFIQILYVEIRSHLKNYELLKTKALKIVSFYEFEFLMNMISFPENFMNDDGYVKIRGIFADLSSEIVDRQKLFSFYKLKLKTMHIRYHYVFTFRVLMTDEH